VEKKKKKVIGIGIFLKKEKMNKNLQKEISHHQKKKVKKAKKKKVKKVKDQ
jgi:hypothetical protein